VAVKLAEVCPAATVTPEGTLRLPLLLVRETAKPPMGAASVKETLHDALPGVLTVVGVQLSPLNEAMGFGRVIVPEPPVAGIDVPSAVEATTLVSCTGIVVVDGFAAIWKVAVATVPSAITLLFRPKMMQLFPEQETDLPAFVADAPATTVTLVISDEKLKVHWRPAVWAPPEEVKVIGSETLPPAVPDADPIDNVTLWAKAAMGIHSKTRKIKNLAGTCVT
jgi:hypothetical protein